MGAPKSDFSENNSQELFSENKIEITPESPTKEWLSTDQAAEYLGVSSATLRNLCSDGKIPYYKWQRRNRYRTNELRILLLATKRGGSNGN